MHAFIFGDLSSQSFCGSLHLLGIHGHTGQFRQQFATLLEANHGTDGAQHAREGWRQRGVFYTQMLVARTVPVAARGAVIVGSLESQRAEYAFDLLGATPGIACFTPTRTTHTCTGL